MTLNAIKQRKRSFKHSVARWLYSLLLLILMPLLVVVFRRKLTSDEPTIMHRKFVERFGIINKQFKPGGIHIHCVSVGEVNAAYGLIKAIQLEYPLLPITLTTSSTTGAAHAFSLFKNTVQHCYLPFDLGVFMKRFYAQIAPSLVLVTEVEIWPNMLHVCQKRGIPSVLINGRMTQASARRIKRFSWLFRETCRHFSAICAQSSESFENFLAIGVYKTQLHLSKNMKFDLKLDENDTVLAKELVNTYVLKSRPILLAASTHAPEEKMILDVYKDLKTQQCYEDLLLVIVPRHPHRFDEVHQLVSATGFSINRVSQQEQIDSCADCLLVDKMGWLKACYSLCTVAVVGGSFAGKGGHNALEAALYAKPIVMGPSIYNNPIICESLAEQNALVIANDKTECLDAITHWLTYPPLAEQDGARGAGVLKNNAGAIEFTLNVLSEYLT